MNLVSKIKKLVGISINDSEIDESLVNTLTKRRKQELELSLMERINARASPEGIEYPLQRLWGYDKAEIDSTDLAFRKELIKKRRKEYPMPMIFVDNDALAFFDVNKSTNGTTDVAELNDKSIKEFYGQLYNFLVHPKQDHYFRTDNYKGPLRTISVTSPCIVFCAFITDGNGGIKRSGVYHADTMPPKDFFQNRLYELIETVRLEPHERVTVKAAGSDGSKKHLQEIREDITKILAAKDIEIELEHLLLGGGSYRRTEFYPRTGQLVTYFSNSQQKTIL